LSNIQKTIFKFETFFFLLIVKVYFEHLAEMQKIPIVVWQHVVSTFLDYTDYLYVEQLLAGQNRLDSMARSRMHKKMQQVILAWKIRHVHNMAKWPITEPHTNSRLNYVQRSTLKIITCVKKFIYSAAATLVLKDAARALPQFMDVLACGHKGALNVYLGALKHVDWHIYWSIQSYDPRVHTDNASCTLLLQMWFGQLRDTTTRPSCRSRLFHALWEFSLRTSCEPIMSLLITLMAEIKTPYMHILNSRDFVNKASFGAYVFERLTYTASDAHCWRLYVDCVTEMASSHSWNLLYALIVLAQRHPDHVCYLRELFNLCKEPAVPIIILRKLYQLCNRNNNNYNHDLPTRTAFLAHLESREEYEPLVQELQEHLFSDHTHGLFAYRAPSGRLVDIHIPNYDCRINTRYQECWASRKQRIRLTDLTDMDVSIFSALPGMHSTIEAHRAFPINVSPVFEFDSEILEHCEIKLWGRTLERGVPVLAFSIYMHASARWDFTIPMCEQLLTRERRLEPISYKGTLIRCTLTSVMDLFRFIFGNINVI